MSGFFEQFILIITAAVVFTALFRRANLPPILAYIAVGTLFGPYALGMVDHSEGIHLLSELGIVFLLFMLGLEFSLPRMMAMRSIVLGMGSLQVAVTSIALVGLSLAVGLAFSSALVVAAALSLSSTALVTRELIRHNELSEPHGRISLGILLFQDVAAVFFLILIPSLKGGSFTADSLLISFAQGAGLLILLMILGRKLLPILFHEVAYARSQELFVLTSLLAALAAAWITHAAGLSMALGGFLAGMMLSESHYKHQLEADIRPFRDLLLGLFFISVGAQLALPALAENWMLILGCALGLILLKAAIVFTVAAPWHPDHADKLKAGLCLGQGGEFGFALLALAFSHELTSPQMNAILVATIVVTMILTPIMMGQGHQLVNRWLCHSKRQQTVHEPLSLEALKETGDSLDEHVIVCGYGRVGQVIARFLAPIDSQYVVMDADPIRVKEADLAGEHIVFGDCRNVDMLRLLGADRAKLLILTFPEYDIALEASKTITREFPDLQVLVRTTDDSGLEELQSLGVTEVIPETLEASLTLVSHALALIGIPHEEVESRINKVRGERYELLHGFYHGLHSSKTDGEGKQNELRHAFTVSPECFASGNTLGGLNIEGYKTEVETVRRDKESFYHPPLDFEVNAGDIIVLKGHADDVAHAEEFLSTGHT